MEETRTCVHTLTVFRRFLHFQGQAERRPREARHEDGCVCGAWENVEELNTAWEGAIFSPWQDLANPLLLKTCTLAQKRKTRHPLPPSLSPPRGALLLNEPLEE